MATGDRKYTVQESNNLSLGQTKSMWLDQIASAITPPTGTVFIAIQCIQDVRFDAAGLVAEDPLTCVGTNTAESYTGGVGDPVTASTLIPAGTILYGRWTSIKIDSGVVMAYCGG
jgi:hypothetical protein